MSLRSQSLGVLTTLCVFVGMIVIVQLWLLSTSLEAVLGGDIASARHGAIASVVLLAANGGLLLFASRVGKR